MPFPPYESVTSAKVRSTRAVATGFYAVQNGAGSCEAGLRVVSRLCVRGSTAGDLRVMTACRTRYLGLLAFLDLLELDANALASRLRSISVCAI
jgi:hypothetical protein